jgi:hypothetical protein
MNFIKKSILKFLLKYFKSSNKIESYSAQSKIIIYLWFILTVALNILNTIVFLYPYWFGSVNLPNTIPIDFTNLESTHVTSLYSKSNNLGYFGLYRFCTKTLVVLPDNKYLNEFVSNSTSTKLIHLNEHNNSTKTNISSAIKLTSYQTFFKCSGHFSKSQTILNSYFKASTYLVGLACIVGYFCVFFSFLIAFALPQFILYFSSFLQMTTGNLF